MPEGAEVVAAAGRGADLAGFCLAGDDAIDATRALRAALHGFVGLERAGGFGLPADINRSFDRLFSALAAAIATWSPTTPEEQS